MKRVSLALISLFVVSLAHAKETILTASEARIFAPMKGSNATAGYGILKNTSNKEIKLTLEKVSPFKAVELHETLEKDGRMAMQKVAEFAIPAKGSFELKPGGNHIMLFDATRELKENETLKVVFKVNGKAQEVDFKVVPRVSKPEEHHHH